MDDHIALFENWGGMGKGYVDLTWERYKIPILSTENERDCTKPGYERVVEGQLKGALDYASQHPDRLLGTYIFRFAGKVWNQCPSEGSFGAFAHSGCTQMTVHYQPQASISRRAAAVRATTRR
jgi:hypothetical protein